MKLSNKNVLKYLLVFLILMTLTSTFLLKKDGFSRFIDAAKKMDIKFACLGILCGLIFIICEAFNLKSLLTRFEYRLSIIQTMKYAFIGFFFCSVTPSASGGQPMQVYYMKKDKIKIAHSSLALLIEVAVFQIVALLIATIGLVYTRHVIFNSSSMTLLIIFGFVAHIVVIGVIVMSMYKPKLLKRISRYLIDVLTKIKIVKNIAKAELFIYNQIDEYEKCSDIIKSDIVSIIPIVFITMIQLLVKYSIPYWVYRGLGFSSISLLTFITIQAILSVAVSSLPLPGAVGASEGSFLVLYKGIFPAGIVNSAALISRGLGFYAVVFISGIIVTLVGLGSVSVAKDRMDCKTLKVSLKKNRYKLSSVK